MEPAYRHSPLQSSRSIRILTLLPSEIYGASIQLSLAEVSLDSKPSYEAVSYVWGTSEPGHAVTVVSHLQASESKTADGRYLPYNVTPNCLACLRDLRLKSSPRALWVDAICIDQESVAERSQQVAMMTEVFGEARGVLVWLNSGTQSVRDIRRVVDFVHQAARLFNSRGFMEGPKLDEDGGHNTSGPLTDSLRSELYQFTLWKALALGDSLASLYGNPYFQRVWTVQELAVARSITVHYGPATMTWNNFALASVFGYRVAEKLAALDVGESRGAPEAVIKSSRKVAGLLDNLTAHFILPNKASLMHSIYGDNKDGRILDKMSMDIGQSVLLSSNSLKSTVPHDKAYSMLWAFPPSAKYCAALRQTDYSKPVHVVFTEYTTALLGCLQSPTPLYLVNTPERDERLPSWVPDWACCPDMAQKKWTSDVYACQATKNCCAVLGVQGDRLRIGGLVHSKVVASFAHAPGVKENPTPTRSACEPTQNPAWSAAAQMARLLKSLLLEARHANEATEADVIAMVCRVMLRRPNSLASGPEAGAMHTAGLQSSSPEPGASAEGDHNCNGDETYSLGIRQVAAFDKISHLLGESTVRATPIAEAIWSILGPSDVGKVMRKIKKLTKGRAPSPDLAFRAVAGALGGIVDVNQMLSRAWLNSISHDFFITDRGEVGTAFRGARPGDTVALWAGCPSPMILRAAEGDGEGCWRLHGPAFVDGVMNGECWSPEPDAELEVFEVI